MGSLLTLGETTCDHSLKKFRLILGETSCDYSLKQFPFILGETRCDYSLKQFTLVLRETRCDHSLKQFPLILGETRCNYSLKQFLVTQSNLHDWHCDYIKVVALYLYRDGWEQFYFPTGNNSVCGCPKLPDDCDLSRCDCTDIGQIACECDKNDNEDRKDEGFVTNMEHLPVTWFKAGDTGTYHRLVLCVYNQVFRQTLY